MAEWKLGRIPSGRARSITSSLPERDSSQRSFLHQVTKSVGKVDESEPPNPLKDALRGQTKTENTETDIPIRTKRARLIRSARLSKSKSLERSHSGNMRSILGEQGGSYAFADKKASKIRLNFKGKKKLIDPDDFIPLHKGKERRRKQPLELLESEEPMEVPAFINLRYRSKMDFSESEEPQLPPGACHPRLSVNLAADAAKLYSRLSTRPELEIVKPYIKDAVPQPYTSSTWTSPARINEDWAPIEEFSEDDTPLIDRTCLKKGYKIEVPRKLESGAEPEPLELMDADKDIKFFAQLCESSSELFHFIGTTTENNDIKNITIISLENNRNKKFQRVIIRTPAGDNRFLISTSHKNKALKNLYNQYPPLVNIKLQKVKKEDVPTLTKKLLETEEKLLEQSYKFGVLYAAKGQTTDDEFFNNGNFLAI